MVCLNGVVYVYVFVSFCILVSLLFLGACTFIIAVCSTPLPNAVFGSSFIPSTRSAIAGKSAFSGAVLVRGWLPHAPGHGGWVFLGVGQVWVGNCIVAAAPLSLG